MSRLPASQVRRRSRGFTLLELLTVVGIVSLMAAGSLPLLRYVVEGRPLDSAAGRLSDVANAARTCAAARQLYVWLALAQDGTDGVWLAIVTTGKTPAYSAGDLQFIQKPVYLRGVVLSPGGVVSGMKFLGAAPPTADDIPVTAAGSASAFVSLPPLQVDGKTVVFDHFVLFSPVGEAMINSDTVSHWIQVGLMANRGRERNGALLQISGLTSQCVLYRP